MSGADPSLLCAACGYEIQQFAEAVEALEAEGACPMCGETLDLEALAEAVEGWEDEAALREGQERAADLAELEEEEEFLDAGPDYGDEGEEEDEAPNR